MSDDSVPEIFLSANRFGIRLGLSRMRTLMKMLGNPHKKLSYIHVAGTNGKGSVVSLIAAALAASGQKVGIYTSPYLERFSERIRVLDGIEGLSEYQRNDAYGEIPPEALRDIGDLIEKAVRRMLSEGSEHPTEFELVTAAAYIFFREQRCDCVVLETGLGGRLDSTNIIQKPLCSVITAIGYDHTDRLGEKIGQIAAEKAGIIKKECPVFLLSPFDTSLSDDDAREVERTIAEKCREAGSPLTIVSRADIDLRTPSVNGQYLRFGFLGEDIFIGLIGRHQALNAALAASAIRSRVSGADLRDGFSKAVWKGRCEIVSKHPTIILDGAHNPQGMSAFCAAVNESFGELFAMRAPRLIIGVMKDKDYSEMIRILLSAPIFSFREIICVTVAQARSLSGEELADTIRKTVREENKIYNRLLSMYNTQGMILASEDAKKACAEALTRSSTDGSPILCVGSLYLVGQVRGVFTDHPGGATSDGLD